MSIISLGFNNKNQFRKFPLKQGTTFKSTSGNIVPDDFLVNCSLTSIYGRHRIYIKQITYIKSVLSIAVASWFDSTLLGVFSGKVSAANNTTLTLTAFERFVSGSITIGQIDSLARLPAYLNFEREASEFEESVIFCYTPPAVKSISDKANAELRGSVNFGNLLHLTKSTSDNSTKFEVNYVEDIMNNADKSSFLDNCDTPKIKSINNAKPAALSGDPTNTGNMYFIGVKPLTFSGIPTSDPSTPESGTVFVDSPELTLNDLCVLKHTVLPPVDISGFTLNTPEFINKYYSKPAMPAVAANPEDKNYPLYRPQRLAGNIYSTKLPEFYYWPQFVRPEYYYSWNTPELPGSTGSTGATGATGSTGATGATGPQNPAYGTPLQTGVTSYIAIDGKNYRNGTYTVFADGNGGTYVGNFIRPVGGSVLGIEFNYLLIDSENVQVVNGRKTYIADGAGGYSAELECPTADTLLFAKDNGELYKADGECGSVFIPAENTGRDNSVLQNYVDVAGVICPLSQIVINTESGDQTYMLADLTEGQLVTSVIYRVTDSSNPSRIGGEYSRINYVFSAGQIIAEQVCPNAGIELYRSQDGFKYVTNGICDYSAVKLLPQDFEGNQYPAKGTSLGSERWKISVLNEIFDVGVLYKSADGRGGYTETPILEHIGYLKTKDLFVKIQGNYFKVGREDYSINSEGVIHGETKYIPVGTFIWSFAGVYYYTNGVGGYNEVDTRSAPSVPTQITTSSSNGGILASFQVSATESLKSPIYSYSTDGGVTYTQATSTLEGDVVNILILKQTNNGENLRPNILYRLRFKAYNQYGTSPASNAVSATL